MAMDLGLVLVGSTLLAVIGFQRWAARCLEYMTDRSVLTIEPVRFEDFAISVGPGLVVEMIEPC